MRKAWCFLLLVLACASCAELKTACEGPDPNNLTGNPDQSGWRKYQRFAVTRNPGTDGYLSYTIEHSPEGIMMIGAKTSEYSIRILRINERYFLTTHPGLPEGTETEVLDEPVLTSELAIRLLYSAFPEGPPSDGKTHHIDHIDNTHSIKVSTLSLSRDHRAPWVVKGTVACREPGRLTFQMTAYFLDSEVALNGEWLAVSAAADLEDDMPLDGWRVYKVGRCKKTHKDWTFYENGAVPVKGLGTLGEVKRAARRGFRDRRYPAAFFLAMLSECLFPADSSTLRSRMDFGVTSTISSSRMNCRALSRVMGMTGESMTLSSLPAALMLVSFLALVGSSSMAFS
jgi:hypothetical protein